LKKTPIVEATVETTEVVPEVVVEEKTETTPVVVAVQETAEVTPAVAPTEIPVESSEPEKPVETEEASKPVVEAIPEPLIAPSTIEE